MPQAARIAELETAFADQDPAAITAAVLHLLESPEAGQASASTYWHPLGFFRIELGRHSIPGQGRFGLHVWPAGYRSTQVPAFPVHRHVHHITSCVLWGELTDTNFGPSARQADADIEGPLYKIATGPGFSDMTRLAATIRLSQVRVQAERPGQLYVPAPGESFHQTDVDPAITAITAVHIGRQTREYPDLVGDPAGAPGYHYDRVPVPQEKILAGIGILRDMGTTRAC